MDQNNLSLIGMASITMCDEMPSTEGLILTEIPVMDAFIGLSVGGRRNASGDCRAAKVSALTSVAAHFGISREEAVVKFSIFVVPSGRGPGGIILVKEKNYRENVA